MFGVSVPGAAQSAADVLSPFASALLGALPAEAHDYLVGFWTDERASAFTLLTGDAEKELALAAVVLFWATARPGVVFGFLVRRCRLALG